MPSSPCCRPLRVLLSFPTRRSSDLGLGASVVRLRHQLPYRPGGPRPARGWRLGGLHRGAAPGRRVVPAAALRRADHGHRVGRDVREDRKSTRLNSSHVAISYAVFSLLPSAPCPPLVPYTTLFRSWARRKCCSPSPPTSLPPWWPAACSGLATRRSSSRCCAWPPCGSRGGATPC